MPSVNHFVGVGRLTRDPDVRGSDEAPVVAFAIAINRFKGRDGKEETDFLNVVTFGRAAAPLRELLAKGRLVMVEGRVQQSSWEQDGQRRTKVEINAYNVQLIDKPKREGDSNVAPGEFVNGDDEEGEDRW